jgi:uncharacterized SAM-binding protein YcdF (DUF218 family)
MPLADGTISSICHVTYTQPLLSLFLLLLAIGVFRTPRSSARRLLAAAFVAGWLITWPPAEWLLSRPLEAQYPVLPFRPSAQAQAIVVLSSDVSPAQFERPYPLPDEQTYNRCLHAAWIHRSTGLPVLVSGGAGRAGQPYADAMRDLLISEGISPERIWSETRSHSTYQNALYSAAMLRERGAMRVVLVTDARSMPRAAACFRRQGVEVEPAPSKFRYLEASIDDWIPNWKAVRGNELTLHEVFGLLWYKWRGWA